MQPWRAARSRSRPRLRQALWLIGALLPCALMLSSGPAEARRRAETLLVLPLEQELGRDAAALRPVEDAFRAEAEALGRYRVSPRGEATALLDSVRSLGLDCEPGDIDCLTKAGVVMEIDLLVVLRAAASHDRLIVSAVLVDVARGRMRAAVNRTVAPGGSLRDAVHSAVVDLLAPDLFVGTLVVEVAEPGAEVRVDGVLRGTTPLPVAIEGLAPGDHVLHVEKDGLPPVERLVHVHPLESTTVSLSLTPVAADPPEASAPAPEPSTTAATAPVAPSPVEAAPEESEPPPLLPLVFTGVAGVSALAAVGTGVGAFLWNQQLQGTGPPPDGSVNAAGPVQALVVASVTTGAVALVAAGVSGTLWVMW